MVSPPYQRAVRLSATATGNWQSIDGYYSGQGIDLLRLPFSRFLSVVFVWAMTNLPEEDGKKWQAELDKPIPGQQSKYNADAELAQIKNM